MQKIKTTQYINDTEGSMLCHISPAAYTQKGSFILYATPQKGREGHLISVIGIVKPTWGHANGKTMTKEKKWWDAIKVGVNVKGERLSIKIPKGHKNQTRTTNCFQ